ncbi:MAG: hypothetical protein KDA31_00310 [Phycisphaerales bacterium]|nr:hypothetical protein [Phycisphaerales bacterium]MCB9835989.1 hypothetical protein [Phycisphaera sp.]
MTLTLDRETALDQLLIDTAEAQRDVLGTEYVMGDYYDDDEEEGGDFYDDDEDYDEDYDEEYDEEDEGDGDMDDDDDDL